MKKISTLFLALALGTISFAQTRGLSFDGQDDIVTIPGKVGVLTGSNITFESWVKFPNVTGFGYVVNKGLNSNYFSLIFNSDNMFPWEPGEPYLNVFLSNGNANGQLFYYFPTTWYGQWHHYAVTYNGSQIILYVDGVQADATNFSGNIPLNTERITLGDGPGFNAFAMTLDEVRIWNTARTAQQIMTNMGREIAPSSSGLVAYYRLNDGIPDGSNAGKTTAIDLAPSPTNGTLVNFSLSGSGSNFTSGFPEMILPLKNSSFVATKTTNSVQLNWLESATASATRFEIERSTNGVSFNIIGSLTGAATTRESSWSFVDTKPEAGTNYYRLKSTEANGRVSYSSIVAVKMTGNNTGLQVYPVPARSTINIEVTTPRGPVEILIKNLAGATVKSVRSFSSGTPIYTSIDVSSLSKGTYVVSVNKESSLFVKQ